MAGGAGGPGRAGDRGGPVAPLSRAAREFYGWFWTLLAARSSIINGIATMKEYPIMCTFS